jgi:hypothetical protein
MECWKNGRLGKAQRASAGVETPSVTAPDETV